MKKSKYNYKIYNGKAIRQLFENKRIYILTIIFSFGIIVGASSLNNLTDLSYLKEIIKSYTSLKSEQGLLINFLYSFTVNIIFILINIFLGFSLIGYPFIMIIPALKGLGMGIMCGYFYSAYKLSGLGYTLLVVYPGAVTSTFAFLLSCNDCCEYSKNAYSKAIRGRGQFEKNETKIFIIRQLFFSGICAASSMIDALFTKFFSNLFEI